MNFFYITGGITKKTGNLYYPLKKPSAPLPPHPQKRESTRKEVGASAPIL